MWGELISAGASLASGMMGSDAAADAGRASAEAISGATQVMARNAERSRQDLAPYQYAGSAALKKLMMLTGVGGYTGTPKTYKEILDPAFAKYRQQYSEDQDNLTPAQALRNRIYEQTGQEFENQVDATDPQYGSLLKRFGTADFEADPGYQFRKSEGEKALTRTAAARGLAMSTPGLKDMMRFSSDLASQEYGNAYNRDAADKARTFSMLSGMAGSGQQAAGTVAGIGTNAASGMAGMMAQGGQMQADAIMGGAGAMSQALQGGLANYMYQQRYEQQMNRMPVFSGSTGPVAAGINWDNV